jgi:sarcosine oxidase delta subunit
MKGFIAFIDCPFCHVRHELQFWSDGWKRLACADCKKLFEADFKLMYVPQTIIRGTTDQPMHTYDLK